MIFIRTSCRGLFINAVLLVLYRFYCFIGVSLRKKIFKKASLRLKKLLFVSRNKIPPVVFFENQFTSSLNAVRKSSLLPFFVRSNKLFNQQQKNKNSLWKNQANIFQCIFHPENRMVHFVGLRLRINRDPFFDFNRPKFVNVFLSRKSNGTLFFGPEIPFIWRKMHFFYF